MDSRESAWQAESPGKGKLPGLVTKVGMVAVPLCTRDYARNDPLTQVKDEYNFIGENIMFRKTLALLIAIAALGVLVFGVIGSGAWFTDAQSIENNSVTTGTLDLTVTGGPFTGTKLEPGADYKSLGVFCVENVGDYDMKWRGWVYEVNDSKGLSSHLLVRAVMNPTGFVGNYGPSNEVLFSGVPFTSLVGENDYIVLNDAIYPFQHGHKACYDIQARLLSTAPNAVQDAQLIAKLYIQGTQYINTGWGE